MVLDLDPHYLHGKLDERIGTLPEEARAAFAYEVACRNEAACGRIAMYWLLDESREVRLGAADGFRERAQRGIVDPISAALVPLIRNWMPADAGRTLLDEALAEARRRELVAPLPPPEWRRAEIYGSIPDMWGSQMLRVVLQGREEPAVATVVTEPGRGVGQAMVISGMEAIGETHRVGVVRSADRDPLGNVRGPGRRGLGGGAGGGAAAGRGTDRRRVGMRDVGTAPAREDGGRLVVGVGSERRDRGSTGASA